MNGSSSKWIDICVPISDGMPHWPGEPPVSVTRMKSIENGHGANVSVLSMSAHTGTHMDAPLHFIENGKDITAADAEILIGEARVIEIRGKGEISADDISSYDFKQGERILLKTGNSDEEWFEREFNSNYAFLAGDAAAYLARKGVVLVGIDYLSIAKYKEGEEAHKHLLGNGIWIIEGLYLKEAEEGVYDMICLPLKIRGSEGAPARVMLRKK